jgi:hypothetical protein
MQVTIGAFTGSGAVIGVFSKTVKVVAPAAGSIRVCK